MTLKEELTKSIWEVFHFPA